MEKVKKVAKEMLQNATWSIEQLNEKDIEGMLDILLKAKCLIFSLRQRKYLS